MKVYHLNYLVLGEGGAVDPIETEEKVANTENITREDI